MEWYNDWQGGWGRLRQLQLRGDQQPGQGEGHGAAEGKPRTPAVQWTGGSSQLNYLYLYMCCVQVQYVKRSCYRLVWRTLSYQRIQQYRLQWRTAGVGNYRYIKLSISSSNIHGMSSQLIISLFRVTALSYWGQTGSVMCCLVLVLRGKVSVMMVMIVIMMMRLLVMMAMQIRVIIRRRMRSCYLKPLTIPFRPFHCSIASDSEFIVLDQTCQLGFCAESLKSPWIIFCFPLLFLSG